MAKKPRRIGWTTFEDEVFRAVERLVRSGATFLSLDHALPTRPAEYFLVKRAECACQLFADCPDVLERKRVAAPSQEFVEANSGGVVEREIPTGLGRVEIRLAYTDQMRVADRSEAETLVAENRKTLEDRVWRAYGMLRSARTITSEETIDLLSAVRMGVNLGLIDTIKIATVNELFIQTQPAYLQKLEGRKLDTRERDVARAAFIHGAALARTPRPLRRLSRPTAKSTPPPRHGQAPRFTPSCPSC